ncbi:hypothetical protein ACIQCJ_25760 [Streptomyces sp. NPDC093221]|uniref:hypothetical protein n=1 Tax=Streptomyces sp. NPDC093221 TaxID=3366032 RepID=UPI0038245D8D
MATPVGTARPVELLSVLGPQGEHFHIRGRRVERLRRLRPGRDRPTDGGEELVLPSRSARAPAVRPGWDGTCRRLVATCLRGPRREP